MSFALATISRKTRTLSGMPVGSLLAFSSFAVLRSRVMRWFGVAKPLPQVPRHGEQTCVASLRCWVLLNHFFQSGHNLKTAWRSLKVRTYEEDVTHTETIYYIIIVRMYMYVYCILYDIYNIVACVYRNRQIHADVKAQRSMRTAYFEGKPQRHIQN